MEKTEPLLRSGWPLQETWWPAGTCRCKETHRQVVVSTFLCVRNALLCFKCWKVHCIKDCTNVWTFHSYIMVHSIHAGPLQWWAFWRWNQSRISFWRGSSQHSWRVSKGTAQVSKLDTRFFFHTLALLSCKLYFKANVAQIIEWKKSILMPRDQLILEHEVDIVFHALNFHSQKWSMRAPSVRNCTCSWRQSQSNACASSWEATWNSTSLPRRSWVGSWRQCKRVGQKCMRSKLYIYITYWIWVNEKKRVFKKINKDASCPWLWCAWSGRLVSNMTPTYIDTTRSQSAMSSTLLNLCGTS